MFTSPTTLVSSAGNRTRILEAQQANTLPTELLRPVLPRGEASCADNRPGKFQTLITRRKHSNFTSFLTIAPKLEWRVARQSPAFLGAGGEPPMQSLSSVEKRFVVEPPAQQTQIFRLPDRRRRYQELRPKEAEKEEDVEEPSSLLADETK